MKWIIVAGATGRFGQEVCARLLNEGYGVHGICRELNEDTLTIDRRFAGARWSMQSVDVTRMEMVADFMKGPFHGHEVIGLVNAVRYVPKVFTNETSIKTWETNIVGFLKLVQFIQKLRQNVPLSVVDIADEDWATEVLLYRAACVSRRQLAKDLALLCPSLRMVTIVRSPEVTPEKVAQLVADVFRPWDNPATRATLVDFRGEINAAESGDGVSA